MNSPTTITGPLGSTIHVLRADAGTVGELAAIDWNRYFPQVCLDPVRGLITLMSPSHLHDDLSEILGHIVDAAGSIIAGTTKGIRSTRLRGQDEPPGTGMEPDCAFYIGERARSFRAAFAEGVEAADAFIERTAPDLVVEVESTHWDASKIERYAELGVRELWRLCGHKKSWEFRAEFFALRPGRVPLTLDASQILDGLTPTDVCEAVQEVRAGETRRHRTQAVERIVRRRRDDMVRVREEAAAYSADRADPTHRDGGASAEVRVESASWPHPEIHVS